MGKTSWNNQYKELGNQSKFHETVRSIFCTELPFSNFKCWQEVNVKDLFPEYRYNSHHYDWYIEELNTIIELHGSQHYKATAFGKMSYQKKMLNFYDQRHRDNMKAQIAIENDMLYVVIPYSEKILTASRILEYITESSHE